MQETQLWSEKYRPKNLKEIIGNQPNIERICSWLKDWNSKSPKAVLISGPPGIGKTTVAHLCCKEQGYSPVELNASNVRNQSSIRELLTGVTGHHSILEYFGSYSNNANLSKQTLIMDEVDGVSAGDRGGIPELIKFIKKTQVPIICICNDRQSTKIRTLANHCIDLRFRRSQWASVRQRILMIAQKEELKIDVAAIEQLVSLTQCDLRQIINTLQTYKLTKKHMNQADSKNLFMFMYNIFRFYDKNHTMNPFDVAGQYFNEDKYKADSLMDRLEYYFNDFSIIPLMVQENYIRCNMLNLKAPTKSTFGFDEKSKPTNLKKMELLSAASDSIVYSDMIDSIIFKDQNWSLMPIHAFFSCALPSYYSKGHMQGMYQFPNWLGQNSKSGKSMRQLQHIYKFLQTSISGSQADLRLDYISHLFDFLAQPLISKGTSGIEEVIKRMDYYFLNKEHWDSLQDLVLPTKNETFKLIPTTVKAAFTRNYNKLDHPINIAPNILVTKKSKRAPANGYLGDLPDMEELIVDEEVLESDDSEEEVIQIKIPAKKRAPTSKMTSTPTKRGRGRGRAH